MDKLYQTLISQFLNEMNCRLIGNVSDTHNMSKIMELVNVIYFISNNELDKKSSINVLNQYTLYYE